MSRTRPRAVTWIATSSSRCQWGASLRPGDIAAAIAFLADPVSSGFVNGVTLPVDGGWTADATWTTLRLRKR